MKLDPLSDNTNEGIPYFKNIASNKKYPAVNADKSLIGDATTNFENKQVAVIIYLLPNDVNSIGPIISIAHPLNGAPGIFVNGNVGSGLPLFKFFTL